MNEEINDKLDKIQVQLNHLRLQMRTLQEIVNAIHYRANNEIVVDMDNSNGG